MHCLSGDENGLLKIIECQQNDRQYNVTTKTLSSVTSRSAVSKLSMFHREQGDRQLAVARADSSISVLRFDLDAEEPVKMMLETKEDRMKAPEHFVGLRADDAGVYSCTSAGHLRFTPLEQEGESSTSSSSVAYLPTRLREMRLSSSKKTLAYGGDEVPLSVWDLERALASKAPSPLASETPGKKRKKSKDLFPGEIWRARNEPHDFLDLREPVRVTALAYLSEERLVTGNYDGTLKLYDTRAGRRTAASWKKVMKETVKVVEPGVTEHQLFAGDSLGNLSAIDTRTGRIVYSYKGIAGAITAITGAAPDVASMSRDRFFRLHSAPPPEEKAGSNQSRRGAILAQHYLTSEPTALVWCEDYSNKIPVVAEEDSEDEELWDAMAEADEDEGSDDAQSGGRKRRKVVAADP